jgi:hypothetical protein
MLAAAFAMAMTAGTPIPVSDFFPQPEEVRLLEIHKAQGEATWPFVAESGTLTCVKVMGKRMVSFIPNTTPAATRAFAMDEDLLGMSVANFGDTGVLKPLGSLEDMVKVISPFIVMGRRLCDQPPGIVKGSEL